MSRWTMDVDIVRFYVLCYSRIIVGILEKMSDVKWIGIRNTNT